MTQRSRHFSRVSLLTLVAPASALGAQLGCASTLPPPPPPVVTAPAAPPPPPPPDVTAVAPPQNLLVFARVSNPAASMKIVTDWARLPSIDPMTAIDGLLSEIAHGKHDPALAAAIDPTQPVEAAVSFEAKLPPAELGAVSVAVKGLDAARTALGARFDLTPGENGVVRLTPRAAAGEMSSQTPSAAKDDDDADAKPACELAPAAGAAPYRLICGSSAESLRALGPYLARTTPRRTIDADVHLEVHVAPIGGYATIGRLEGPKIISGLLGLQPATEPATLELVNAALGDVFDYVGDLDAMTLDARLDQAHAGISMRTTFKSATSWMAQLSTAHPERVDAPPATLWRLPGEVDMAGFGNGVDDADLAHPRDLLVAAAREQLAKAKVGDADRRALVDLLKEGLRGSKSVFAHGVNERGGYWLVGWDEPATRSQKLARDLVAALHRPGLVKFLKGDAHSSSTLPTVQVVPAGAGLPHGALHLVVTVPPDVVGGPSSVKPGGPKAVAGPVGPSTGGAGAAKRAASKAQPQTLHVVIAADGARSWFGFAETEEALRAPLAAVLAGKPAADSLGPQTAARGLAPFAEARMTSGAFFTVRTFVELARQAAVGPDRVARAARWEDVLKHLPAKGIAPLVVTAAPRPGGADDPGGARDVQVDVPADFVRDAVWFGMQSDLLDGK
jgi:hypothetical protein